MEHCGNFGASPLFRHHVGYTCILYEVLRFGISYLSFKLSGVYYSTPRYGSYAGGTRVTIKGQGTIDFSVFTKMLNGS